MNRTSGLTDGTGLPMDQTDGEPFNVEFVEFPLVLDLETKDETPKLPAPRVNVKDSSWMDNLFHPDDSMLEGAHGLRENCAADYARTYDNGEKKQAWPNGQQAYSQPQTENVPSTVTMQQPHTANLLPQNSLGFSQQLAGSEARRQCGPHQQPRNETYFPDQNVSKMRKVSKTTRAPLDPLFSGLNLCTMENSGNSTFDLLRTNQEPTLLTLTSFPFRVVYANKAYMNFSSQKCIIGQPIFDSFHSEDSLMMKPSFGQYPSLLKMLENGAPRIVNCRCGEEDEYVPCRIRSYPVACNSNSQQQQQGKSLQYYAVRFRRLDAGPER